MWQCWKLGGSSEAIRFDRPEIIMGFDRSLIRPSSVSPILGKTEAQVLLGVWMGGKLFLLFRGAMKILVLLLKQGNELLAIPIKKLHRCI